jgi:hypothetical protein
MYFIRSNRAGFREDVEAASMRYAGILRQRPEWAPFSKRRMAYRYEDGSAGTDARDRSPSYRLDVRPEPPDSPSA